VPGTPYCTCSLNNPNAFRIGSSCIENKIASSVDEALLCSCHDHSGTMKVSPFLPVKRFAVDYRRAAAAEGVVDACAGVAVSFGALARYED
jgi:hypothetical protein